MRSLLAIVLTAVCTISAGIHAETVLPELLATLEFDRKEALVKEQILVKLRVGYPPGAFGMSQSTLEAGNAELVSLRRSESIENHNGHPYRFVQTEYVLFGNSPGQINLSPMQFNALLPVSAGGINSKSNPEISTTIQSKSINIHPALLSPPVNSNQNSQYQWLAASDVTMTSQWGSGEDPLVPGLPVHRQIVIHITGQHPAAVPELPDMQIPDGLRAYPEAATRVIEKNQHGLSGSVILPFTLVAGAAGRYELPEITLPWWDINHRKWRNAVLGKETLEITPSANSKPGRYREMALAAGLLLFTSAGLLYLIYYFFIRNSLRSQSPLSEKQAWRRVRKSVKKLNANNYSDLRAALQYWALTLDPDHPVVNLEQLAERFPPSQPVLNTIDQSLYSRSQRPLLSRQLILKTLTDLRQSMLMQSPLTQTKGRENNNRLYPENIAS